MSDEETTTTSDAALSTASDDALEKDDGPLPTDIDLKDQAQQEPELTFEQRYDKLSCVVEKQSEHREIYLKTLAYCDESKEERDVESYIQTLPEFAYETQSPYYLILALVQAGGLERFELDEQGEVVTPEQKEGLTEDEADDLVWSIAYQTTDVGMTIVEDMQPQARLERLFTARPKRKDTYCEVLEFCLKPRSCQDIEKLLDGRSILTEEAVDGEPLKPSVFIDKLERSGVLVWDGRWNTSDQGKAYLEAHAS